MNKDSPDQAVWICRLIWASIVHVYDKGIFILALLQFVCVELLQPSQPIRVMLSEVSLPNHTFSWVGFVSG